MLQGGLHAAYQDSIPLVMFVGHEKPYDRTSISRNRPSNDSIISWQSLYHQLQEMVAMAKEAIDLSMDKKARQ